MAIKKKKKQSKVKKGAKYACSECGIVVSVVDPCDCVDACDLYCCGVPMKTHSGKKGKK